MPSSQARSSPATSGGKRVKGRTKQKRLDAIVDRPPASSIAVDRRPASSIVDDDPGYLRRSSRVRRVPVVLDSSPFLTNRTANPEPLEPPIPVRKEQTPSTEEFKGSGGWRSRLRSRLAKGREMKSMNQVMSEGKEKVGLDSKRSGSRKKRKKPLHEDELENVGDVGEAQEEAEQMDVDDHVGVGLFNGEAGEVDETLKPNNVKPVVLDDKDAGSHVKEGRRCGLCGGGISGRPPKRLAQESVDSDKEAYEGASASEEPNYDMWDGFGDEPGWLGRLLGPIHDRFGIARVWVHQHCAVWSPEVYFAGLGCLKNVRAALCRGRVLKCSRCGRSGATIGCRVDRCPKTYHLPCSRADGCIFDHWKFLIACHDHRHLFQPQGIDYSLQIKKMKAKKLKLDMRKVSTDAWRKDLEAEDKWLENCGEDEEFLKREGRRLHRDILRIAPVYIGGSSESGELYQGWESVAGLQEVIQCMKEVVILPLLYPEFFSSLGLTPPRGILLHGYPGTGKTLVVRALIGACSRGDKRIAYFARKGADCLGKYVGDAERQLRLLFQVAERSQPSIIFFDEIDGLAPLRSRHQDQTHCSVVSTLLSLMDGLKSRGSVIVIGATNRPEAIDPALRRPGRFDREIYFPLPSEKGRSEILSLHTRSWPNPVSGSLLSWVANQTAGYAGADLQALCTQAAMNALKRNCPLQELLSSAERGSGHGNLPSLPSFIVEERDWLRALALAPPPCSRRDAGSSANDAVCSPLQPHLVPYLLQPLSQLLASFYIDERIWLPPRLFRASESIKRSIVFALEQKKVPTISWWSHVHCLAEDPFVENEIERGLSSHGLIIGPSGSSQCYAPEDGNDDHEKLHIKCRNSSGFRALISGAPRSGQKHLASCLLHGFSGHIEIQKVTLATMSLEGHGDLIRGLAHILLKCLNAGPCIIYMPRIDLWAIDKTPGQEAEEKPEAQVTPISSLSAEVPDARESASEAWNSFVEQVDSACTSQSIIILATCEVENKDLPIGIRQFFTSNVLDHTDSAPLEHSIPRFYIHLDGKFDHDQVLDSSAVKLSQDLVRHYVQLLHFRAHMNNSQDKNKVTHSMEVVSELQRQNMEGWLDSERISSNSGASCRNNPTQQDLSGEQRWSVLSKIRSFREVNIQLRNHQDFTPRALPGKVIKGGSMLAITTFGYQILRYPQFAELCWVTSKLKEGPSANPNGPWKHWPFNSGVTYPDGNCSNFKDKENTSLVRGLIAVGLLAYRGVYTSVREVSFEVRKVLELLVEQIREKILSRRDRYRYLRVLSQVAYLEDMVNSWAYTFQSLQTDNQTIASNAKPTTVERLHEDKNLSSSIPVDNQSSMVPSISCNEVQEVSHKETPQKFDGSNGQCGNFSNGIAYTALLNSDASMVPEANQFQELSPSSPTPSTSHPTSSLAPLRVVNGDGPSQLERTTPSNGSLDNFAVRKNNLSGVPAVLCLYECCSECLQAVYMLVHSILSGSLRLNGHCSTLDDIDAVIASCSVNLLAAIGKVCASQSNACQEFGKHDKKSCCHSESKGDTAAFSSGRNSLLQSPLSFFFRDGVLVPSNPEEDAVFHCKFERLCTCSILETMLMIKQPFD